MIGYCVKCRKKQNMNSVTESRTSRGVKLAKGTCSVCGTKMSVMQKG